MMPQHFRIVSFYCLFEGKTDIVILKLLFVYLIKLVSFHVMRDNANAIASTKMKPTSMQGNPQVLQAHYSLFVDPRRKTIFWDTCTRLYSMLQNYLVKCDFVYFSRSYCFIAVFVRY